MLDPVIERSIRARLAAASFAPWMGLELTALDDGASELRLTLQEHHLNPGKIAHGGVVASILDSAIGLALRTKLSPEASHVTLQLHVNYLRPAALGTIIARATAVHAGARTGYGEATLSDANDRVLARANATFMVWDPPGGGEPEGE